MRRASAGFGMCEQRGTVTVVFLCAALILGAVVFGAIVLGLLITHRVVLNNSSDALALAHSYEVARVPRGEDTWTVDPATVLDANGAGAAAGSVTYATTGDDCGVWTDVVIDHDVSNNLPLFGRAVNIAVQSRAEIAQSVTLQDELELLFPHVSLVLDYSRSMDLGFSGGGGHWSSHDAAIDVLKETIEDTIDGFDSKPELDRIYLGLVLFGETILASRKPCDPVGAGGCANDLKSTVNVTITQSGEGNMARAVNEARHNHVPDDALSPRTFVIVSDGAPERPGTRATAMQAAEVAAERSADASLNQTPADTMTVFIRRHTPTSLEQGELIAFMGHDSRNEMALKAGDPPSPEISHALEADTPDVLYNALVAMNVDVHCASLPLQDRFAGPIDPGVPLFAYLRTSGGERQLERKQRRAELAPPPGGFAEDDGYFFWFDEDTRRVVISEKVCEEAREDANNAIVARFGYPRLVPPEPQVCLRPTP